MQDLLDSVAGPNETLLITFTATNCGPCRLQKRELHEFRQQLTKDLNLVDVPIPIKMLAIDTEKWPDVGRAWFAISKLPCVVILRDKQVIARLEGLTRAHVLMEHIRPHLFS